MSLKVKQRTREYNGVFNKNIWEPSIKFIHAVTINPHTAVLNEHRKDRNVINNKLEVVFNYNI